VNYLLVQSVDTYSVVYDGDLSAAAADIRRRLAAIFLLNSNSQRPLHAGLSICLSIYLSVYLSVCLVCHCLSHRNDFTCSSLSLLRDISRIHHSRVQAFAQY